MCIRYGIVQDKGELIHCKAQDRAWNPYSERVNLG